MIMKTTETSLHLTWNNPNAGGEAVDLDFYWVDIILKNMTLQTNESSVVILGLSSNTEYKLQVTAVGKDGRSGIPSNIISNVTRGYFEQPFFYNITI